MTNKTARITRSTSRFLKQLNMINEVGNLIKVDEREVLNLEDKLNENKIDQLVKNEKKSVSFGSVNLNAVKKQQLDKENKSNDKNSSKKSSLNRQSKQSIKNLAELDSNDKLNDDHANTSIKEKEESNQQVTNQQVDNELKDKQIDDQLMNNSSNEMECSPIKQQNNIENEIEDSNLITPKNKQTTKMNDEEWLTDDESSIKVPPNKFSNVINSNKKLPTSSKIEASKSCLPELRVGVKRSATLKSATKPTIDIKRNKTNEFTTPQSIKKLSRPFNYGSANKKLTRLPTATATKSAVAASKPTSINNNNHLSTKLKKPDYHNHLEVPSQTTTTTNNRYLVPPSSSASSSISSQASQASQASLKSCPSTAQPTNKTLARNLNSNNSEGKQSQQRCFAESALKQKLDEEKRRKALELKIAKEEEAKLKKDKFLQQRVLETKFKREERERKVREHTEAEHRRIAEQKKQTEELKRQLELQKQIEEAKKLAELKRIEEAKKAKEQKQLEEAKRQEEMRKQEELRQHRLQELKEKQTAVKKVEFKATSHQSPNEDLQTKLFGKLEKKLIEDDRKCQNTPIKQLIVEAVGKKNAEKSLYKPAVDPSLDLIDLSLSSNDSSLSINEEDNSELLKTVSNCTFIKDINSKALSSTFIKPVSSKITSNITRSPDNQANTQLSNTELANANNKTINDKIASSPEFESYDISDLRSDDEDDDEQQIVNKRIPAWARGDGFIRLLKEQFRLGSRARENEIKKLFVSIESNVPLEEVFCESKKYVSKRYERRTSSACWSSPPLTYIDKSFSTFY